MSWALAGGVAVALSASLACESRSRNVLEEPPASVLARLSHRVDATLAGGAVRYLGFDALPEGAFPGDEINLVHYWSATRPLEPGYRVFVHFLVEGARGWIPHGDHEPVPGTDRWPPGKVVRDEHPVQLPEQLPGERVAVRVGLYRDRARLPIDAAHDDGDGRIRAGSFAVSGRAIPLPSYAAPRLAAPPTLDGTIDDAEWAGAPWIERFSPSRGDGESAVATRARLAWDAEHLYLAFDCRDPDILGGYDQRDQPVYREEAVEIFIDPSGGGRDYVELQASPKGTLFDAAFSGGARQKMKVEWNARYVVAVALDGTVEPAQGSPTDRDRGWRSEWAIEAASIPGLATPLVGGAELRVNLFRVGKDREGRAVRPDESAWSPPLMGDFHNLERFGRLSLVP